MARAFQTVLEHIEEQILSGRLRVGQSLPPERELAATLRVSRTAVREALRALEAQGITTSLVGAGADAGTRITSGMRRPLAKSIRLHLALDTFAYDEIVDARIMCERQSATLAARHGTAAEFRRMEVVLRTMEADHMRLEVFNGLDTDFHLIIAEMGHNRLVSDIASAIRQSLREPIRAASERMEDWQSFRLDLIRQHRRIADGILARDGARAADAMEAHIRTAYAILWLGDAPASAPTGPGTRPSSPSAARQTV